MPRKTVNILDGAPRYKSLTVDADIVESIGVVSEALQAKFGFKPTISQTLRHLLNTYKGDEQ